MIYAFPFFLCSTCTLFSFPLHHPYVLVKFRVVARCHFFVLPTHQVYLAINHGNHLKLYFIHALRHMGLIVPYATTLSWNIRNQVLSQSRKRQCTCNTNCPIVPYTTTWLWAIRNQVLTQSRTCQYTCKINLPMTQAQRRAYNSSALICQLSPLKMDQPPNFEATIFLSRSPCPYKHWGNLINKKDLLYTFYDFTETSNHLFLRTTRLFVFSCGDSPLT